MSTTPQSGRSTIDTIVRELEQIPEPMQLSVLDFIHSLGSINTVTTKSETGVEAKHHSGKRRTTSTRIAGKGRTLGDIVSPVVDEHYRQNISKGFSKKPLDIANSKKSSF